MKDDEIIKVRCNACGCAITPELHETRSGEYELTFFVCPFCHEKYAVSVTDVELRKSIAECHALKEANDKELLSAEEKQRMIELLVLNRRRSKELWEMFAPKMNADEETIESNGKEESEGS